jgi:hypothetical protein
MKDEELIATQKTDTCYFFNNSHTLFLLPGEQRVPLAESASLNVLERVTVFDTSVVSTLFPLPSPLDTTIPRSTSVCERLQSP